MRKAFQTQAMEVKSREEWGDEEQVSSSPGGQGGRGPAGPRGSVPGAGVNGTAAL